MGPCRAGPLLGRASENNALCFWVASPGGSAPYGQAVALENLAAVWATARRRGAERAVLARVVERAADLDGFRAAVPDAEVTVVRLVAPADVVSARLRGRERGAGLDWHLRRAPELAAVLDRSDVPGAVVVNDGPVRPVAEAVLAAAGW